MKGHPHQNGTGMEGFNRDHYEKNQAEPMLADLKYTNGDMSNPENLKNSVDKLSSYVRKNKMKH